VWSALSRENPPRYLWVFRGDTQADRLRSALGMVIRKSHPALEQLEIFQAVAERLPFAAAIKRVEGVVQHHLLDDGGLEADRRWLGFASAASICRTSSGD
jgi:hypothetical protein